MVASRHEPIGGGEDRSTPVRPAAMTDPFLVGPVVVPNRVILAPMAGMTTSAFRRRARAFGAGLLVTEMVSAYGLIYGDARTRHFLEFHEDERPLALQLFADDPEVLARAVHIVLDGPRVPDMIDINMGCPVRKVMKTGAGAALLADPARAGMVAAAAVRAAATIPVTAKIRSGLTPDHEVAVEVAKRLEEAGVAAIAVHPRAASQLYRGRADHEVTARVVREVSLPVFASGDVFGAAESRRIITETGASAVMVARAAQSGPWVVRDILDGVDRPRPPLAEIVTELRALLAAAASDMGSARSARWIRKSLGWYLKGSGLHPGAVDDLRCHVGAVALDSALESLVPGPSASSI